MHYGCSQWLLSKVLDTVPQPVVDEHGHHGWGLQRSIFLCTNYGCTIQMNDVLMYFVQLHIPQASRVIMLHGRMTRHNVVCRSTHSVPLHAGLCTTALLVHCGL